MSKLAVHVQQHCNWFELGMWAKVIDPPPDNRWPMRWVIGRNYVREDIAKAMIDKGAAGGEEWFNLNKPAYDRSGYIFAWEGPNEPGVASPEDRKNLVAFTQKWCELMHDSGLRTVSLCLSVGWPNTGQDCLDLLPAVLCSDYWAVHEYGSPNMYQGMDPAVSYMGWYCLRYRRTVDVFMKDYRWPAGGKPLLITECGIDGGTTGKPGHGWKSFTNAPEYAQQLKWYDSELAKDPYVKAAFIFTAGPNADWQDFEYTQELDTILCTTEDIPVKPPEDKPPVEPNTNEAIRKVAWGLVGGPVSKDPDNYATMRWGRSLQLGAPLTSEFRVDNYTARGWANGILVFLTGDWEDPSILAW